MNGNDVSLDKVYKIFDADWYAQNIDSQVRYKNGESDTRLTIMAKEMLSLYFVRPHKRVKGAEVPFTVLLVNLGNGERLPVNLEGYIDLIEEGDSICEFKTSGQTMNQSDLDNHLQLTASSYAYEMLYRKPPRALKLIDFVKTKRPKVIALEVDRKKLDYQRFFYLASQILTGIKSKVFFPRTSFMCKDCEYGEPCRAWQGN
jgi:putative RecB family exonuclease